MLKKGDKVIRVGEPGADWPLGEVRTVSESWVDDEGDNLFYVEGSRVERWAKYAELVPDGTAATQPHDTVNNPKHYQLLPGVEVYDIRQALAAKATAAGVTLDQFSDYDRAVEYLLRMWEKNGVEDAKKAAWYLNKLVEKLSDDRS